MLASMLCMELYVQTQLILTVTLGSKRYLKSLSTEEKIEAPNEVKQLIVIRGLRT